MADIELVIKIPEHDKNVIKRFVQGDGCEDFPPSIIEDLIRAVYFGTPLPKGHDRLIEANSVDKIVKPIEPSDAGWGMSAETAIRLIHDAFDKAPTIIEADTAESEE